MEKEWFEDESLKGPALALAAEPAMQRRRRRSSTDSTRCVRGRSEPAT